jgi:predicted nuclease of restriction endonuclease-like (RecB) superfamily
VKNEAARAFYETEAQRYGWSVRQLDRQIGSQFYERIALSKNKAAMLKKAEKAEPHDLIPERIEIDVGRLRYTSHIHFLSGYR